MKQVDDNIRKAKSRFKGIQTSEEGVKEGKGKRRTRTKGKGKRKSIKAEIEGTFKTCQIKKG